MTKAELLEEIGIKFPYGISSEEKLIKEKEGVEVFGTHTRTPYRVSVMKVEGNAVSFPPITIYVIDEGTPAEAAFYDRNQSDPSLLDLPPVPNAVEGEIVPE